MITLTLFQVSTLITAAVSLFLGFFVYFSGEKTKLNFSWLLTSVAISAWSIGLFGVVFSQNVSTAWLWQYVLDISGICVPILFFNFVLHLVKKEKIMIGLQIFSLIVGAGLLALNFTNLFKTGVSPKFGINFWIDPGKLYFLFPLFFFIFVIISTLILIKEYRLTTDRNFKRQLLYVLIAQIFGFGGGLTDFFPQLFNVYPFGNYFIILYVIFISYAALKHHLFDIKVIATELLTFSIWAFLAVKTLLSKDFNEFLLNGIILIAVMIAGIMLIRSVLKEVKQREKMEQMARDLEGAYKSEKLAKERIEKAKAEDEAILSSIGDGVVAVDEMGKVIFINKAASEMLELDSKKAIGKPYEQHLILQNEAGDVLEKEENPLNIALQEGKKTIVEGIGTGPAYYFERLDKTRFPVAMTVTPVVLDGKIIGAVGAFRDVTVERQIDKSKSEFVSLASHQLRTPLTAVKWYSEMLGNKKAGKLSEKQKRYLDGVYQGNERMIKLVDTMLNISRLEAGKLKINPEQTDLRKLVEIIIEEHSFKIKEKKQKFVFECEKEMNVVTDPNMLRQVFQNLISNAVKYTPANGEITCAIKKENNVLHFYVKDSGIGIPKDQQKRIFGKLYRAENAAVQEPDGNGLGLYMTKMIVENMGGKIWFESKENKGTTFSVELPLPK